MLVGWRRPTQTFFAGKTDFTKFNKTVFFPNTLKQKLKRKVFFFPLYLLVKDQVWSKVQHGTVGECVGPPAQGENHDAHPGQLDH